MAEVDHEPATADLDTTAAAEALCNEYGFTLGNMPCRSLDELRSKLDRFLSFRSVQPYSFEEGVLFEASDNLEPTGQMWFNGWLMLSMQEDGRTCTVLPAALERGRPNHKFIEWQAHPYVPLGINGDTFVDRVVMTGDGYGVYFILTELPDLGDGVRRHR